MEEEKMSKFMNQAINDEILEKMSLENVFKIFNDNIFPMLNEEELEYCNKLQEFCLNLNPKIGTLSFDITQNTPCRL